MDNLAGHKGAAVSRAIRQGRAGLPILPPCRPDPKPIEPAFFKLGYLPGNAAESTAELFGWRIGTLFDRF